jgi:hypothetical protein
MSPNDTFPKCALMSGFQPLWGISGVASFIINRALVDFRFA